MSVNVPSRALKIAAQMESCTVAAEGYTASETAQCFTRGEVNLVSPSINVRGQHSGIWIAENAYVQLNAQINGKNSGIVIGPNCRLRRLTVNITGDDCFVIFGAETTSESATILTSPNGQYVVFGNDCMLSNGVFIRTDDGHSVFDRTSQQRLGLPAPVVIHPHVWIGNSAIVKKGTTIGQGTIIGQNGIAIGQLEPYSAYAGNPCRLIKSNIVWSRTRSYEDIPPAFR